MYDKLMKHTAIGSIMFSIAAMCIMLYVAFHTTVEASVAAGEISPEHKVNEAETIESPVNTKELAIVKEDNGQAYLCIPLSENITEEQLVLEANYVEQQLCITITGQEEGFYNDNRITDNSGCIGKVLWSYHRGNTKLQLQLNGLYEHNVFCKNNMLFIEFKIPREEYDKIVVIDAGNTYGEIPLTIVKRLKEKLDATDIRAYYTRLDESNPSQEKRVALANLLKADMLISVQVNEDTEDSMMQGIQTIYNPTFFIPLLSSIDLADIMEKEVCRETGAAARGLIPAEDSEILVNKVSRPVTIVQVGYVSNKKEKELLEDDSYIEKVADGLYDGIMEAYAKLGKEES